MKSVQRDLDQALPLVAKAEAALAGLKVKDFQTLKALANPPPDISKTFTCVLHLMATINPDVQVDKKGRMNSENPWKNSLKLMQKPEAFLENLNAFKLEVD
jgi:dynein heavy chain